jgi:hypothetical protein
MRHRSTHNVRKNNDHGSGMLGSRERQAVRTCRHRVEGARSEEVGKLSRPNEVAKATDYTGITNGQTPIAAG